jgi:hypothetical protein
MENKWTLTIGIHRGTLMSRDVEQPKEFDTYEEVVAEVNKARKDYASYGYVIWFANVVSPDGKESCIESNPYYS